MFRYCTNKARAIGASLLLCAPVVVGCGADSEPAQEEFEVTSDVPAALTREEFSALHCFPGIQFCGLELSGGQRVNSNERVKAAAGHVDVLSGSVRVRIFSRKLVGSDELRATYRVNAGKLIRIGASAPGIDRRMWVIVDQADGAKYNLAVDFT